MIKINIRQRSPGYSGCAKSGDIMRQPVFALVIASALILSAPSARATIFSALNLGSGENIALAEQSRRDFEKHLASIGATRVEESEGFGLPRVDASKAPAVIAVGELKSIWRGGWQLGGGKIVVNRASDADIPFDGASERVKFSARWTAGNEAVSVPAKDIFRLRIFSANADGTFTEAATATKEAKVGGKGFGGTKFERGTVSAPEIPITETSVFFVVYEVENSNSKDLHRARTWVRFVKKS